MSCVTPNTVHNDSLISPPTGPHSSRPDCLEGDCLQLVGWLSPGTKAVLGGRVSFVLHRTPSSPFCFCLYSCFVFMPLMCRNGRILQDGGHQQTFFEKAPRVNISGFKGRRVVVTTTQLCVCSAKACIDNVETEGHVCVPIKLYLNEQTAGHSLPTLL